MGLFPWELDDLLTEQEARAILSPFAAKLGACPVIAWERWLGKIPQEERDDISAMQRGGVLHDLTVAGAKATFGAMENECVEICNALGIFKVYFTPAEMKHAVVRFRKTPASGLLVPEQMSDQCREWYWHNSLAHVRPCTRLTCAYVLNQIETEIEDVMIVLQVKDRVVWKYSIREDAESLRVPVAPLPTDLPPATIIGPIDGSAHTEVTGT